MSAPLFPFTPQRMRDALAGIGADFPTGAEKAPLGLTALFKRLAHMKPFEIGPFAKTLMDSELQLLCDHYAASPNTRVLAVVVAILAHRGDVRLRETLFALIHRVPNRSDMNLVRTQIAPLGVDDMLLGSYPWLLRLLQAKPQPEPADFVWTEIETSRLSLESLFQSLERRTPLMDLVAARLFRTGSDHLAQMRPRMASRLVNLYLSAGDSQKVIHYLNIYPEEHWPPEILESTYTRFGPPDPKRIPFYNDLETGRIWTFRRRLFQNRLGNCHMTRPQQDFWERWLHRCQDLNLADDVLTIEIRPFRVNQTPAMTFIFALEGDTGQIDQIPTDGGWSRKMEELFGEYLKWGYHA